MEKNYTLAEAYHDGGLKQKGSEKVNQVIIDLWNFIGGPDTALDFNGFRLEWDKFVKAVIQDFPNISPFNLGFLHIRLQGRGLKKEHLFVRRLVVEIIPNSSEAHCFLGHAYKEMNEFALATKHYEKAFELQMDYIESKQIKQDGDGPSVQWLDAADYLCYAATAQKEMKRDEEAIVLATKALNIIGRDREAEWKKPWPYAILGYIFKDDAKELAISYFECALEIASRDRLARDWWFLPEIKKELDTLS